MITLLIVIGLPVLAIVSILGIALGASSASAEKKKAEQEKADEQSWKDEEREHWRRMEEAAAKGASVEEDEAAGRPDDK